MKVTITPSTCHGSVIIPPSKSMAHRAIIAASLANGTSHITNIAYSDDIKITIEAMKQFGADITCFDNSLTIIGKPNNFATDEKLEVFCKESGTSLRFLIPIFSLKNTTVSFTGENRLLKRPQKIYEDIFTSQNLSFYQDDYKIEIKDPLQATDYTLDGNVSSQFISGLLLTLPLLDKDSTITIHEPYESRSYVDLTIEMLSYYGIDVAYETPNKLVIKGNQAYTPYDYRVEADYSQAGFFAVLAAINNDLEIRGLSHTSQQGDKEIIDILKDFNVDIEDVEFGYHIHKSDLLASTIDLKNCPDLGPILNVLMMYTPKTSNIINAQRLRYKESDRIAAMEEELLKCGVNIKTNDGDIAICGDTTYATNQELSGHKDHRIVMALCIAATLFQTPTTISDAESINKSYPSFFEDLRSVGIGVDIHE